MAASPAESSYMTKIGFKGIAVTSVLLLGSALPVGRLLTVSRWPDDVRDHSVAPIATNHHDALSFSVCVELEELPFILPNEVAEVGSMSSVGRLQDVAIEQRSGDVEPYLPGRYDRKLFRVQRSSLGERSHNLIRPDGHHGPVARFDRVRLAGGDFGLLEEGSADDECVNRRRLTVVDNVKLGQRWFARGKSHHVGVSDSEPGAALKANGIPRLLQSLDRSIGRLLSDPGGVSGYEDASDADDRKELVDGPILLATLVVASMTLGLSLVLGLEPLLERRGVVIVWRVIAVGTLLALGQFALLWCFSTARSLTHAGSVSTGARISRSAPETTELLYTGESRSLRFDKHL